MIKLDFEKYTQMNDLTRRLSNVFNQVTSLFSGVESRIEAVENKSAITGSILMWPTASAPNGYLLCAGGTASRTSQASLFSIIGTTYGVGDGATTFGLPDFRALVPRGAGDQTVNTRVKTGPALGAVQEDQMQLITGSVTGLQLRNAAARTDAGALTSTQASNTTAGLNTNTQNVLTGISINTSTSPGARTSGTTVGETRVNSFGINYIIKT